MLSFNVSINKYGACDLAFNVKPDNAILDKIKAKGFKWFKTGKCWSTFKFKTKEECIEWVNSILSDSFILQPVLASKEILKVEMNKNTPTPKKAVEKAKNSVKKGVSNTYQCDEYKLKAYFDKIKPDLEAKYNLKEMILLLRENGYACIQPEAFERMKTSDRNKLLKNYVVYSV